MTCNDCIHYDVCGFEWCDSEALTFCKDFKDKSCIIELPVLPRKIVYVDARILNTAHLQEWARKLKVISCYVTNIRYDGRMKAKLYLTPMSNRPYTPKYHIFVDENAIGKTVFLTEKEAKEKLKELNENG